MSRRLHEVEGAVRGNEGDGAVVLEPCQPHTLMELDVLHLHALVLAAAPLRFEQHLRACAPMCQLTPDSPAPAHPLALKVSNTIAVLKHQQLRLVLADQ